MPIAATAMLTTAAAMAQAAVAVAETAVAADAAVRALEPRLVEMAASVLPVSKTRLTPIAKKMNF